MYWNTREPYIKQRNLLEQKNNDSSLLFFSYFVLFIKIINKENVTQIYGVKSQYINKCY